MKEEKSNQERIIVIARVIKREKQLRKSDQNIQACYMLT